jgi:hypothetical protein
MIPRGDTGGAQTPIGKDDFLLLKVRGVSLLWSGIGSHAVDSRSLRKPSRRHPSLASVRSIFSLPSILSFF